MVEKFVSCSLPFDMSETQIEPVTEMEQQKAQETSGAEINE